jgi:hypothetical protein
MVGRKSTLKTLLAALRTPGLGVTCVQTTTFHQGRQARWGIAWTYDDQAAADWQRRNKVHRIEETGGGPPKSAFQFRIKADTALVSCFHITETRFIIDIKHVTYIGCYGESSSRNREIWNTW